MMRLDSFSSRLLCLVVGASWLSVIGSCGVSCAGAEEGDVFVLDEVVEVRVLNLEVVVVDQDGRRVRGLPLEDFRVRVDGQEVPVEFFSEKDGERWGFSQGYPSDSSGVGSSSSDSGSSDGVSYLVFIDERLTAFQSRIPVLAGLARDLGGLQRNDRMAVVAFDGRQLRVLSDWSQSWGELQRVLRQAMKRRSGIVGSGAVRSGSRVDPCAVDYGDSGSAASASARLESQLRKVSLALVSAMRSFSFAPGRKVLVALAGNWPLSPGSYVVGGRCFKARYDELRGADIFGQVFEQANMIGFSVYPVDVGRRNLDGIDMREAEVHSMLEMIADQTGGVALLGGKSLSLLEPIARDLETYYSLGISPGWTGDDSEHKVEVEVLSPGLRVRHRKTFRDLSRAAQVNLLVEGALLTGFMPGSQALEVELGSPRKAGRRLNVPLKITVPMAEIVMVPSGRVFRSKLQLRIASVDAKGRRSEIGEIPLVLEGERAPREGDYSIYETTVRVRFQPQKLVVSVHDPVSESLFSAVQELKLDS